MNKDYEKYAVWSLTNKCSFKCEYCFIREKKFNIIQSIIRDIYRILKYKHLSWVFHFFRLFNNIKINKNAIENALKVFDNNGKWLIGFSGEGEPFLFPRFVDVVKRVTKKHMVCIDTNLSQDINEFCSRINPKKVLYINCAIHILEREKKGLVTDFIKKYKILKNKGYNVDVNYIMYPPLLKRFLNDFNYFKKQGIKLQPYIFYGVYNGKKYPLSYNKKDISLITKHSKNIKNQQLNFNKMLCPAGKDSIVILSDGSVVRCDSDKDYLGNIYTGKVKFYRKEVKCKAKNCSCPGQRLNVLK